MGELNIGALNRRIVLLRYSMVRDGKNRPVETYTPLPARWASWRRATANERLASAQVSAQVTDVFETHWASTIADLDAKCRLTFGGRTYDIVEVTEIGLREGLLIRAAARSDVSA